MALPSKVFTYQAELIWRGGRTAAVTSGNLPELTVAPPEEFAGGGDDRWSPEHLFLASLETVHDALVPRALRPQRPRGRGLHLGRDRVAPERRADDQRYAFTHVAVEVHARMAAGQADAARGLTGKAERDCFISASTTATVETDWQITG